jgi:hypothetical protein
MLREISHARSYQFVIGVWRSKRGTICRVNDWEIIADNLSKAGWSWGYLSAIDFNGQTIWIADAHGGDGKRFVVRAARRREWPHDHSRRCC